jgi:hypothetical protein
MTFTIPNLREEDLIDIHVIGTSLTENGSSILMVPAFTHSSAMNGKEWH